MECALERFRAATQFVSEAEESRTVFNGFQFSKCIKSYLLASIVGSAILTPANSIAASERITFESGICEFINEASGEYIRDERCLVELRRTPIIVTAVELHWSDGVVTRASMNVTDIDFVGVLETEATIDGVPGRYITTGLTQTNCFEIDRNRNKICFSIKM